MEHQVSREVLVTEAEIRQIITELRDQKLVKRRENPAKVVGMVPLVDDQVEPEERE